MTGLLSGRSRNKLPTSGGTESLAIFRRSVQPVFSIRYVEFVLLGDPSGTVRGKHHLREYFQKVLTTFPEPPDTELLGVYQGVESLLVHFQGRGRKGIEVMELNQKEKIRRAITLGSTLNLPLPPLPKNPSE